MAVTSQTVPHASQTETREAVRPIRLLVSVRSVSEAEAALHGGCDILDVKEPARGPLGMADFSTLAQIRTRALRLAPHAPFSIALGDIADWPKPDSPRGEPLAVQYVKLGLGVRAGQNWRSWPQALAEATRNIEPGARTILVAYADHENFGGPAPEEALKAAANWGCAGLLIDTSSKSGGTSIDFLGVPRLMALAQAVRQAGLSFSLAGRLTADDLPEILQIAPDVLGVRSAVCVDQNRNGPIDEAAVSALSTAMQLSRPSAEL